MNTNKEHKKQEQNIDTDKYINYKKYCLNNTIYIMIIITNNK